MAGKTLPFFFFLCLQSSLALYGQVAPDMYWVSFTDKNNSPYSIDNPEEFLSIRAIDRRIRQNIPITVSDLPVNPVYTDSLKSLGIEIHNVSKWFNGAVIKSKDQALLDTLHTISFIKDPLFTSAETMSFEPLPLDNEQQLKVAEADGYLIQVSMIGVDDLHTKDLKGQGMLIAILDAGFNLADSIESVQPIRQENRLIATKDFVKDGTDLLENHSHGTMVFSIIGADLEDELLGTAPKANYLLVRTENGNSEYLVEEYNWLSGAEYADSAGADIINSSLGYYTFDTPGQNHSYSDLDGKTTPVTKAAVMASRKGILVVNSAGNEGNDPWYNIIAPADADSILSIGAVNKDKELVNFSSRGPTADNRIKPDVCARGGSTFVQSYVGSVRQGSGTSFSAPLISGMAACLWQAFPYATNQEIRKAIIQSADRFTSPNNDYGYGIPNANIAHSILATYQDSTKNPLTELKLYPNPTSDQLTLNLRLPWLEESRSGTIMISTLNGQQLFINEHTFHPGYNVIPIFETLSLAAGLYFVHCEVFERWYHGSFIKTE